MQPASEDSMPSAGLRVRPFPPVQNFLFLLQLPFVYLFLLNPIGQSLKSFRAVRPCTPDAYIFKYVRLLYLGASWTEACYYYFPSIKLITYVFFHMYLFFAIICIVMT